MILIACYLGVAMLLVGVGLFLSPDLATPDVAQWEHRLYIQEEEHRLHMQDLMQRTKVAVAVRTVLRSGRMITHSKTPHIPQPDRLAHLTIRANLAARTPQIQRAIERAKSVKSARNLTHTH